MAEKLNEIDLQLLRELETDADRPNVELARVIGPVARPRRSTACAASRSRA